MAKMSAEVREFLEKLDGLYQAGDGPTGISFEPANLWWAIRTARLLLRNEK